MEIKKIFTLLFSLLFVVMVAACGPSTPDKDAVKTTSPVASTAPNETSETSDEPPVTTDDAHNGVGNDHESGEVTLALPKLTPIEDARPEEAKQVTFKTLNGNDVTYNRHTRRIVALSGCGDLAAFGIQPLAMLGDKAVVERYKDFFEGVELLEYTQPYNIEEILKYEPELILVYQLMDEENIEELSKVAPVIPLYRESFDFDERLGYIGEIFGLEDRAEALIAYAKDTQQAAVDAVDELDIKDQTVNVFYYLDGVSIPPTDFWYFNKILYDYLDLEQTQAVQDFLADENNGPFTPISNEKLKDYEGDLVLYADLFGDGQIPPQLDENPGWKALHAVQEDRIGVIDAMLYAEKDVLYLAAQYEGLLEALKLAIGS